MLLSRNANGALLLTRSCCRRLFFTCTGKSFILRSSKLVWRDGFVRYLTSNREQDRTILPANEIKGGNANELPNNMAKAEVVEDGSSQQELVFPILTPEQLEHFVSLVREMHIPERFKGSLEKLFNHLQTGSYISELDSAVIANFIYTFLNLVGKQSTPTSRPVILNNEREMHLAFLNYVVNGISPRSLTHIMTKARLARNAKTVDIIILELKQSHELNNLYYRLNIAENFSLVGAFDHSLGRVNPELPFNPDLLRMVIYRTIKGGHLTNAELFMRRIERFFFLPVSEEEKQDKESMEILVTGKRILFNYLLSWSILFKRWSKVKSMWEEQVCAPTIMSSGEEKDQLGQGSNEDNNNSSSSSSASISSLDYSSFVVPDAFTVELMTEAFAHLEGYERAREFFLHSRDVAGIPLYDGNYCELVRATTKLQDRIEAFNQVKIIWEELLVAKQSSDFSDPLGSSSGDDVKVICPRFHLELINVCCHFGYEQDALEYLSELKVLVAQQRDLLHASNENAARRTESAEEEGEEEGEGPLEFSGQLFVNPFRVSIGNLMHQAQVSLAEYYLKREEYGKIGDIHFNVMADLSLNPFPTIPPTTLVFFKMLARTESPETAICFWNHIISEFGNRRSLELALFMERIMNFVEEDLGRHDLTLKLYDQLICLKFPILPDCRRYAIEACMKLNDWNRAYKIMIGIASSEPFDGGFEIDIQYLERTFTGLLLSGCYSEALSDILKLLRAASKKLTAASSNDSIDNDVVQFDEMSFWNKVKGMIEDCLKQNPGLHIPPLFLARELRTHYPEFPIADPELYASMLGIVRDRELLNSGNDVTISSNSISSSSSSSREVLDFRRIEEILGLARNGGHEMRMLILRHLFDPSSSHSRWMSLLDQLGIVSRMLHEAYPLLKEKVQCHSNSNVGELKSFLKLFINGLLGKFENLHHPYAVIGPSEQRMLHFVIYCLFKYFERNCSNSISNSNISINSNVSSTGNNNGSSSIKIASSLHAWNYELRTEFNAWLSLLAKDIGSSHNSGLSGDWRAINNPNSIVGGGTTFSNSSGANPIPISSAPPILKGDRGSITGGITGGSAGLGAFMGAFKKGISSYPIASATLNNLTSSSSNNSSASNNSSSPFLTNSALNRTDEKDKNTSFIFTRSSNSSNRSNSSTGNNSTGFSFSTSPTLNSISNNNNNTKTFNNRKGEQEFGIDIANSTNPSKTTNATTNTTTIAMTKKRNFVGLTAKELSLARYNPNRTNGDFSSFTSGSELSFFLQDLTQELLIHQMNQHHYQQQAFEESIYDQRSRIRGDIKDNSKDNTKDNCNDGNEFPLFFETLAGLKDESDIRNYLEHLVIDEHWWSKALPTVTSIDHSTCNIDNNSENENSENSEFSYLRTKLRREGIWRAFNDFKGASMIVCTLTNEIEV